MEDFPQVDLRGLATSNPRNPRTLEADPRTTRAAAISRIWAIPLLLFLYLSVG
jgi:hypothetical protein